MHEDPAGTIDQRLTKKVASMSVDQRIARMDEIVDSPDRDSEELALEYIKLLLGPDADIADGTEDCDDHA
jgi:hypothetical protein